MNYLAYPSPSSLLVKQECRGCGVIYFTSKVNGEWRRVDASMERFTLDGMGRCVCGSYDLSPACFDNGGMLVVNEEVE